jgi:uncharacterized protein YcbX
MSHATITDLIVYPIKSCRGIALEEATIESSGIENDRRWMIVNDTGRYMTQRELPRMATIVPALSAGALSLTAPGMPALEVPDAPDGPSLQVTVMSFRCSAMDAGARPAEWLSEFLGRPVRLVRFDPQVVRPIDPQFWQGDSDAHVAFPDAFPLLLISRKSLDDLNSRLEAPLPMNRFRPNVVLEGLDAYEEDRIDELRAGALRLQMARPCTRCKITTTDQMTGEVLTTEPIATLRRYRWNPELRGVMFGRYALVAAGVGGRLRRGQSLEFVSVRPMSAERR